MNKEWHGKHRMPKNATRDQRIVWHAEHARNCSCREMPRGIAEEIWKRGQTVPRPAYEIAKGAGIIGIVEGPTDLSTNRRHFSGFGREK